MTTFLIFFLGASLGSFFGLIIDRFPDHSIIWPASHCQNCQRRLRWYDLIPILSQVYHRSRCRFCQVKLPFWYAGLELACGLVLLVFWWGIVNLAQLILIYSALILSLYDLKYQEYPLVIWFLGSLPLLFLTPFKTISLLFLLLGLLAYLLPLNIGSGDFLFLASLSLSLSITAVINLLQLASFLAIIYCLGLKKYQDPIPFVPFLSLAYFFVLWLH
ncbi:prepilin peptidase [Streptococcus cuniculipharyngis]|uniref:Prepilin peptidase n=1 Tax=Streptococcus cuniculipharyngis TaxID=1562651 RepID=A0A5C5SBW1_9STRE|nr:A24 family peptidase [Streptococcus cuniculipharyngis]TWS96914.1 prepilin peptidase [Streptococcus cuniculipharyngis]